jgi:intracellular protein transport protein USO1
LADLTQSSTELQKLVAFEGTFDKIFQLIQQEGGLKEGGIIIQDCLDLLANLVRQNSSNQSLFRESAFVSKLSSMLKSSHETSEASEFPNPQMLKNLWGFLAVVRLFLVHGSVGTNINQKTFEKHGLLQEILDLAFRPSTDPTIKTEVS